MGHTRLGNIPKTQKWQAVVSMFAETGNASRGALVATADDSVRKLADAALKATQKGLDLAVDDHGLRYTFYLLTQLVLAARQTNWQQGLEPFGIRLPENATLFDLNVELQVSVDDYVSRHSSPTDVSEMAQQAACEAITALAGPRSVTLFGAGRNELQVSVRDLSTKHGFAVLGQRFFGNFIAHYLNFYLSRLTAGNVNTSYLRQLGDITKFNDALYAHCNESARIVRDFCGEWYSKTEFREGISLDNTSRFLHVALEKLRAELQTQEAE